MRRTIDQNFHVALWHEFGIAVAGATAALAGLLFVAISINVESIVSDSRLPARALGAVITVTTPLIISVLLLVPGQSRTSLGIELIVIGLGVGVVLALLNRPPAAGDIQQFKQWLLGTALPTLVVVASTILAGIGLATHSIGGLYWLIPAVIAAIFGGLLQAWVLLIEIRR